MIGSLYSSLPYTNDTNEMESGILEMIAVIISRNQLEAYQVELNISIFRFQ